MKKTFYTLILFILLTSCGILTSDKKAICKCCNQTYTNIDSALKCADAPLSSKLLLFALVNSDVKQNQARGWDILKDKSIIETAKRDYVLIIIDSKKVSIPKGYETKEFLDILKQEKKGIYFIVTNCALYPFREFTLQDNKDEIINDLELGDGP